MYFRHCSNLLINFTLILLKAENQSSFAACFQMKSGRRKSCELMVHDFQGCGWWQAWAVGEDSAGCVEATGDIYFICT